MALVAVSSVINNTLVPLLASEVKLLWNVHNEVASMKAELESIMAFLKDADSSAESGNERAKNWVKQVRAMAFQIEDVMDEYILHLTENRQRHGFIGFLRKVARSIIKLKPQHDIAYQIQDIKQTIREIKERADRYGFSSLEQGSSSKIDDITGHDPRVASLFIDEDEVVGIESTREELIHGLITGVSNRTVTSLVGMGGCGKTTLAKKVFDNPNVFGHFNCHAWVSVSQSYKVEEVFRRMIKQFCQSRKEFVPEGVDAMDHNSLIHLLREYLLQKRYLIVFDDVWRTDFWSFVKLAVPKNSKGSRVIITTRSKDVATFCKEFSSEHIYELQPLTEEEAWKLFCMKAFQRDFGGCCPPELDKVSRAIVRKCEGLPLAIVTIGTLLCTKNKVVFEWQKFYNSLGSELERNPHLTNIAKILLLSYHDLPYYLKPCFLYFGIVPEDYQITYGRLIRLWVAEGFIEREKGKTLEEVAEEHLTDLVHRSLVQLSPQIVGRRVNRYQVHDVVREIILAKCNELGFCHVLAEADPNMNDQTRRLSMHMHIVMDKVLKSISTSKFQIRSVFLFSRGELPEEQLLSTLVSNFKLMKVLDLQEAPLDKLDEEVGNLLHLRYLSVKRTKVKLIPKSIGNLHNLQTLNLKWTPVTMLRSGIINRLHKLRHLIAMSSGSRRGLKIRGGIGHLEQLQTLWSVEANDDEGVSLITMEELEKLRQLRKLRILNVKRENGRALCAAIEKMKHLEVLRVRSIREDEILDLHSLASAPESLKSLGLGGRLEKLPTWIPKLQNLTELGLTWTALSGTDTIKSLQALPNLIKLDIKEGYDGGRLHFEVGGFQKLEVLYLQGLTGLTGLNSITEEGALPLLHDLWIGPSPQLKEVPSGIRHLKQLRCLYFFDMPTEFLDRMQPDKGQDYCIIEHIRSVWLYGNDRGWRNLRGFQNARETKGLLLKLKVDHRTEVLKSPEHQLM